MSGTWTLVQERDHVCNPPIVDAMFHLAGDQWTCECGVVWEWLGPQMVVGGKPQPSPHGWRKMWEKGSQGETGKWTP